jgi:membrane protease YdiL (CAAX protease family)
MPSRVEISYNRLMLNNRDLALVLISILSAVVILANIAERRDGLRWLVFAFLLVMNVAFVVGFGFIIPSGMQTTITLETALAARFISAVVGIITTLLLFTGVRRRLSGLFPKRLAGMSGAGFDPDSPVHMTALILCVYLLANTVLNFVLAGGLAGVAQDVRDSGGLAINSQLILMTLFILFSLLGVGLTVRRPIAVSLERLGLVWPSPREVLIGGTSAILMYGVAIGVGIVWISLAGSDVIEEQTRVSALIAQGITTLGIALIIAATAAIGEEIAFRGALQPIFGIGVTSLFFALSHVQYILTPASVIIVLVGVALGVLRQRYNTTTAIIAHFFYNYVPMLLSIFINYVQNTAQP